MKALKLMLALIVVLLVVVIALNARDGAAPVVDDGNGNGGGDQPTVEDNELIDVTTPQPGDTVTSPLTITGQARGNWYFEASFPVKLFDKDGAEIASSIATAQGDWMTTEFVLFTSTLTFAAQPSGSTGTLVLYKDNPSGLPENDDQIEVEVTF